MVELDQSHELQISFYVLQGSTLFTDKPKIMPHDIKWPCTKACALTLKEKDRDNLYQQEIVRSSLAKALTVI